MVFKGQTKYDNSPSAKPQHPVLLKDVLFLGEHKERRDARRGGGKGHPQGMLYIDE